MHYEDQQYYYHTDHLNGTRYLTDQNGDVVETNLTFPGGETWVNQTIKRSADDYKTPYTFTGKEQDASGLYYYGARYYDPRAQVWASVDPILDKYLGNDPSKLVNEGVFNSRNLSLYTYSANNPISISDPTGNWFVIDDVITGPVDEIIVIGALSIAAYLGLESAQNALDSIILNTLGKEEAESVAEPDPLDEVLEGAAPGTDTKGRSKIFDKPGGQEQADEDFDKLIPDGGEPFVDSKGGEGRKGIMEDGRKVNVRPNSTDGRPTLEIQKGKNKIKVRYD